MSTVKYLALRGAKVYIAARSGDKAKKAMQSLLTTHLEISQDQLSWLPLDLSDLKSVAAAVDQMKRKETKIDILSQCTQPYTPRGPILCLVTPYLRCIG